MAPDFALTSPRPQTRHGLPRPAEDHGRTRRGGEFRFAYFPLVQISRHDALTVTFQTAKQNRLFSNFYRVAFYGKAMRELNGKEFMYLLFKHLLLLLCTTSSRPQIYAP
jgi:hypothetical protein